MPSQPHRGFAAALVIAVATVTSGGCSTVRSYLGFEDEQQDSLTGEIQAPRVEVVFDGLDDDRERNARAYLGLSEEPCDAPEWRVQRRFAKADEDISRGLRALGHYRPTITKSLQRGETCWHAEFDVDPGPRVTMEAVEVGLGGEASDDPAFKALLVQLPLKQGDPLDHGAYEATKQKLGALAAERGYQDARITHSRLSVDPDAGTARAEVHLESGPRYRLGELTIASQVLDEDVVKRIIEYTPGEPYSSDRLHRINQALSDSGYFSSVDVRADVDAAENLVIPVTVSADPRKRHLYTAGAGFATDIGPRVRLGYENRRINRRGHRLQTRLRASLVESDLTAEYRIPLGRPQSEWLTFSAAAVHQDTTTFKSTSAHVAARVTQLRGKWLETTSLEYSRENFTIGNTDGSSAFLLPGISYARTSSGGALRPDRGWRLFAEVRGGSQAVLSETDLLRARIEAGWLATLPWDGRIITRAEVGALMTGDFDALPPSLRFFAGGDTSIRGYEFESLGPRDASGDVIGGRYLAVASLEYEHPITGAWSAAAFVDAGNAFDNELNQDVKIGVGIGARWQSPVGPVRVDLAHPLNDDGNTIVRLHLRLGPDL